MRTRICVAAFTGRGARLAAGLCRGLPDCAGYAPRRYVVPPLQPLETPVERWAGERFARVRALVFVGAAGIAVRAVAPHLRGKEVDPAVVCVDEDGRFAVPLLSGHIGGANGLAEDIAALTGGMPVPTAATDTRGVFSADAWAARSGCAVADTKAVKQVAAALLDGEPVGLVSDFPVDGPLPAGVRQNAQTRCGILLSLWYRAAFAHTLHLIPRCLVLGVGCVRDLPAETLERQVLDVLERHRLPARALRAVASIDRKTREPAILAFCESRGLPLVTYPARELARVPGSISPSAFVESAVGVDNVCERAALCFGGELLVPKTAGQGVALAVTKTAWRAVF